MKEISLVTKLKINSEILSADIDNELVLMSVETGNYFGLNSVGLRVWDLLKNEMIIKDLLNQLQEEYNVEKQQCETEVLSLLSKMVEKNIVKIV